MNKLRKICIVLTTRGNYAKMRSVIDAISKDPRLELQLVVGNNLDTERYGDYTKQIINDGYLISEKLNYLQPEDNLKSMSLSAGIATKNLSKIFDKLSPNIVLVVADRYEALSVAHAATCMNVLIAHLEGGEISGSIDERIRHAITKLSHIHFPSNKDSAERIFKMGENKNSIFISGSPSIDLISNISLSNLSSTQKIINKLATKQVSLKNNYIVASQHSVVTESKKSNFQILETLKSLGKINLPILWLLPNMDVGQQKIIKQIIEHQKLFNITIIPSLKMEHYAILLKNSLCLIGNSSSGIRECEYLGVPVVNIGTRQNKRLRGKNVIDVDYKSEEITKAIKFQINNGHYKSEFIYGHGSSGKIICDALAKCKLSLDKSIIY